jgi:transposase-like protein
MEKRRKYSPEEKIEFVKEYLSGKASLKEMGKRKNCI